MARGKHGAAAAKRRAESAEMQLDRLHPRVLEAERLAKQYRANAEAAVALRAELAQLRETVGVPLDEHNAIIAELEHRHAERDAVVVEALSEVFEHFAQWLDLPFDSQWINAKLMRALQTIPQPIALAYLDALDISRDMQRMLLFADPDRITDGNRPFVMEMAGRALAAGYGPNRIPGDWIEEAGTLTERRHRERYHGQTADALAETNATYLDQLHQFAALDPKPDHPVAALRLIWDARWDYIYALVASQRAAEGAA